MKRYVYGAGFNCEKCIEVLEDTSDIAGILDCNQEKWNSKKGGIPVVPVKTIEENEFDSVIISVANYVSIVDLLIKRGVELAKIAVYDSNRNIVISLSEIYEDYIEKKIYRKRAVEQVKVGLLMEAYRNREFDNMQIISVFGSEEDGYLIKEFLEEVGIKSKLVYNEILEQKNNISIKYILCGREYKSDLKKIREIQHEDVKWIIVPLYDVENSMDWK